MKNLKRLNKKLNEKGFTLIELMIVVGIIGILVAIAAPNFARYQSKSRQSESKIALAAIYGGEKSFYSEYSAYISSMDAIGYSPEGSRRYYTIGWNAVHGSTVTGYNGQIANGFWVEALNPFACTTELTQANLPANLTGDAQTFTVGAVGCIRNGATNSDQWNITDTKVISNNSVQL
jgi:type IV pilus assembly protein PilA